MGNVFQKKANYTFRSLQMRLDGLIKLKSYSAFWLTFTFKLLFLRKSRLDSTSKTKLRNLIVIEKFSNDILMVFVTYNWFLMLRDCQRIDFNFGLASNFQRTFFQTYWIVSSLQEVWFVSSRSIFGGKILFSKFIFLHVSDCDSPRKPKCFHEKPLCSTSEITITYDLNLKLYASSGKSSF